MCLYIFGYGCLLSRDAISFFPNIRTCISFIRIYRINDMNMLYNTPSNRLAVCFSIYLSVRICIDESVYTFRNTKFICLSYKTPHQKPAPFSFLPISLNRALQA